MYCKNCGNEVLEGEKFCGKCGNKTEKYNNDNLNKVTEEFNSTGEQEKIKNKKSNNIKILKITLPVLLIIIFFCVFASHKRTLVTDKYLTNYLIKNNGFNDNTSVKILDIEDIQYQNFNKLALTNIFVEQNSNKIRQTSLSMINKKDDIVKGITINTNLLWILNGIGLDKSNASEVTAICAKYLKENGEEIFNNSTSNEFINLIKEISNKIGVSKAREYVNKNSQSKAEQNNVGTMYTNLYEKDSAYIKYIAFYETEMEYVWDELIPESTYKIYEKQRNKLK